MDRKHTYYLTDHAGGEPAEARLMTDEQARGANALIPEGNPWSWGRDKVRDAAPEMLNILKRILSAHDSGNNGAVMGEAVLCNHFADTARAVIDRATGSEAR